VLIAKVGYKISMQENFQLELFGGSQNIFDETYSLGNDINAAGGRYYNAAPGRNYYVGVAIRFDKK